MVIEIDAKVKSIDHKTRMVTLELPGGDTLTTIVDDDVEAHIWESKKNRASWLGSPTDKFHL